ncbi:MAG: class I adenylate-forming enzyme family protein [Alphaproteobacteria bacterium]
MEDTAGATATVSATAYARSAEERALAAAIDATPSIQSLLDRHARERPDACALACNSASGDWLRVSWSRLAEDSRRAAAGLRALGVGPGDHVALLLDNRSAYECFVATLGMLRRGAALVPLNTRSTAAELAYALGAAECRWLIAGVEAAERVESARAEVPSLRQVIGVGGAPSGWADWHQVLEHAPDPAAEVTIGPDTVSAILFTSGTTARPKGAVHSHRTAIATGAIDAAIHGLGPGEVLHYAVPFFTSFGAQGGVMMLLWSGCTVVVEPVFDQARMVQRIVEEGTTVGLGVPSQFLFMLDELRVRRAELGRVRLWVYGGAPMPGEVSRALAEICPQAGERQVYAMTETGITGTTLAPELVVSKPTSCGRPMPLCETKIVDEAGRVLKPDEIGEICLRGPGNMLGYYNNQEATQAALRDGWMHTGDIGRMDADGFLYYLDRLKDVINRGGLKISSMEVEDAMYRHASVLEAAVVAAPHPQLGEDIRAFVALRPGTRADAEALRAHCAALLSPHKVPRDIRFIDALPRNSMGKVQKTQLRQLG